MRADTDSVTAQDFTIPFAELRLLKDCLNRATVYRGVECAVLHKGRKLSVVIEDRVVRFRSVQGVKEERCNG